MNIEWNFQPMIINVPRGSFIRRTDVVSNEVYEDELLQIIHFVPVIPETDIMHDGFLGYLDVTPRIRLFITMNMTLGEEEIDGAYYPDGTRIGFSRVNK